MEEILSQVWVWIVSVFGGVSLAGIITAIIYGSLKGAFNRAISKINTEEIANNTAEKAIAQVKQISFTQSIQPIAESELKKVTEQANEYVQKQLKDVQDGYNKLVNVIQKLASFFDGSIYISDEIREDFYNAVEDAKIEVPENSQEFTVIDEQPQVENAPIQENSILSVQR